MIKVRIEKFPSLNIGNLMDKQMQIKFGKITESSKKR